MNEESIFCCPRCLGPVAQQRCQECERRLPSVAGILTLAHGDSLERIRRESAAELFLRHRGAPPARILEALDRDGLEKSPLASDWRFFAPPALAGSALVLEAGWGDASLGLCPYVQGRIWAGFTDAALARLAAMRFQEAGAPITPFLFDGRRLPLRPGSASLLVVHQPQAIFLGERCPLTTFAESLIPGGLLYLEERNRYALGRLLGDDTLGNGRGLFSVLGRTREIRAAGFRIVRRLARLPGLASPRVQFDLDDRDAVQHYLARPFPEKGRPRSFWRMERLLSRGGLYSWVVPSFGILARKHGVS
ncbi:MAG: hypothetical protein V3T77_03160 [Planctomycetota bacterium]